MGQSRPPVRSPWTSSLASSTAMRCSFSCRRTAWCIYEMFRATAPRAPPMRGKTGQQTCAHAPHAVPRRSRVRLTPGPHGKSEDDGDWGEWTHSGRRSHEDRRRPGSPSAPPERHAADSNSRSDRRTRLTSFSFVFALRHHHWAAITSCFARDFRLRKLPYASTMSCTTPFLALRSWSIQTHPNGSSLGRQCAGASCRTVRISSGMSTE